MNSRKGAIREKKGKNNGYEIIHGYDKGVKGQSVKKEHQGHYIAGSSDKGHYHYDDGYYVEDNKSDEGEKCYKFIRRKIMQRDIVLMVIMLFINWTRIRNRRKPNVGKSKRRK